MHRAEAREYYRIFWAYECNRQKELSPSHGIVPNQDDKMHIFFNYTQNKLIILCRQLKILLCRHL